MNNGADSNLIFGYGTMRDDIGDILSRPPVLCEPVGYGRLQHSSLWIVRNRTGTWAGAIRHPNGPGVYGQVYAMRPMHSSIEDVLWALDRREGCNHGFPELSFYHRWIAEVQMEDGGTAHAWCYFVNPDPDLSTFIEPVPSGDWMAWLTSRKQIASSIAKGRYVG